MKNVPMILTIPFCIFDVNFKNPSFFKEKVAMTEGWIPACAGMTERGVGMTEREWE